MSATVLVFNTSTTVFHTSAQKLLHSGMQLLSHHSTYSLEDLLGEVVVDERRL